MAIDAPVADWEQITLLRNGTQLAVYAREIAGGARVLADWPRSGTGRYRLELKLPEELEVAEIALWPRKITRSSYRQLLEDLEQLPPAIAVAVQHAGALAGVKLTPLNESTLASELHRLRRAVLGTNARPGLAKVLHALSLDPHMVLTSTELMLPRDQVRRIHPARLAQAYATGHNLDSAGHPERLPETRVEHTADVYENRLLRAFHDQVNQRIRRLHSRLLSKTHSTGIKEEIEELGRCLATARRQAAFLDGVGSPRQLPTRLTMVLLRRPEYRAALEGYLDFRRTVSIHLDEPALDAPLENLPSLYETWGTLQIIKALVDTAIDLGYSVREQLFRRDASGLFLRVLRNGRPALVLKRESTNTTAKLIPQRTYGPTGVPLSSASYPQTPDIAVEIEDSGHPTRVLIFDPKYKLQSEELEGEITDGRPKKVDIDKMHAYRDAIRAPDGKRPVEYAAILYPGAETEQFGTGLEALASRPGEDTHLSPRIRQILRDALADGASKIDAVAIEVGPILT